MTLFLFILNFSLVIIAFFLIILLYVKFTKIQEMEQRQSKTMKEMEDLVGAFLHEMKDENENFLKNVNSFSDSQKRQSKEEFQVSDNRTSDNILEKKLPKIDIKIQDNNPKDLLPNYKKDESESTSLHNEPRIDSLLSQVLGLHNQGYQIEDIAKMLKKGKTEIELLLKFHQT